MRPPTGNVTFLFTDIEHSTQLWEKHPQAMGKSLAQHDQLVRSLVEAHHGHVFKTVGDAFCVAFQSAQDAVAAAADVQRKLTASSWGEVGQLRVRMALHSGESEERDGDYFGPTLNRVARLLSAGHGGQTLLSSVTAERVREELAPGVTLRDLGERRLRDLSRPERVYQLVTPGLPDEFPPLRSLEVLPNNLPAQVTSFVGRSQEMAELKRLLDTTRLLTLTGSGGTGKTRLSLQVAAEVLERFPHGVWLVELATVSDPARVPETLADAVGIREEPQRPILETVIAGLRTRQLLIVLDNCEHLVAACAQATATLLRRCPYLRILASSREALNIEGERIWPVPPLPVPEYGKREALTESARVAELAAVQLFVERAAAANPGFKLTPENVPLVAQICWRLDGIPLAIELAAARLKVLTLDQVLTRLDDRFRLLSGGSRAAPPRHQTMGALIDWSYDLLSENERILLRRLAVFVGGRTLEMAEEVCSGEGIDKAEIFDLLSALVEKSLVTIEPGVQQQSRYTMLESVWDYADEKLTHQGETTRFRRRHLEYFVRLGQIAEPALLGPEQRGWLERLNLEHANLNAALRAAAEDSELVEAGLRLAGALTRYWEVRNYLSEGYEHFRRLLEKADGALARSVLAKAELGAGRISWCQDRDADARRHYLRARELYETLGALEQVGFIEANLGYTERSDGHDEASRKHFERAKEIAEQQHSIRVLGMAVNGLGNLAADAGDYQAARAAKEKSLAISRSLGDVWAVTLVTGNLGALCCESGDYASARQYLRESLSLAQELDNKWGVPYVIEALANVRAKEQDVLAAVRLYGAASIQREALALAFAVRERGSYNRAISQLRALVSPEVFEREWNEGRKLSSQEAIALAVGERVPSDT